MLIRCQTATYKGNPQYLEIYSGYLTVYGISATSNLSYYTFIFADANGSSAGNGGNGGAGGDVGDDNVGGGNGGATTIETVTYTFSNYTAGTQYALNETHKLDDTLTVITDDAHFTTQIRLYCDDSHNGTAIFQSSRTIQGLTVKAGYKDATLNVYGSANGSSWTLIDQISVSTSYADYTVDMNGAAYTYILLEAEGKQVRVEAVTVTYGEGSGNAGGGSAGDDTGNGGAYTSGITSTENGIGSSANSPLHNAVQDYIRNDSESADYQLAIGLPAEGTYRALVIPVQFSNDKFNSSELSDLEIAFNGTSTQTGWQSVSSYYTASSFGKLNLSFDIANPVTMPRTSSYYETDEYGAQNILDYALDTIDDSLDLSNYDTNGDGYIDAVYIIYSVEMDYYSDESNYWAFVTWHFESDFYDGVKAHYYLFASVDFMYEEIEGTDNGYDGLKINATTYIHETGHLLGLDDYYDYNVGTGSDEGLGGADIMDYAIGDHNVYSKLMLGWVTPTVVTSTQTVTINSSTETGDFIMILLDGDGTYFSEYLLIDLYTATGINSLHGNSSGSLLYYDPNDEYEYGAEFGARIYHVSASIENPFSDDYYSFTDNNNSMTEIPLIKLVEADGDKNFESDTYESGKYASSEDLWQSGDKLSTIQPNYQRNDGKTLNFDITFTSVTAQSATVTITFN